jgi:hypothetical protein
MSYLPVTLNHFKAVKDWADNHGALVALDVRSFGLEVKFRNRGYTLKPRFVMKHEGKLAYTTDLVKGVTGFIGWLPYGILQWDISQNKLLAKKMFGSAGLKAPAVCLAEEEIDKDFVVKSVAGSFGYQVRGPYRPEFHRQSVQHKEELEKGQVADFAEQFIVGTNLKVWYWGAEAIYAQVHPYPTVVGDGLCSAQVLIESKLASAGATSITASEQQNFDLALAFQDVRPSDVMAGGRAVWIDFRYGRRYMQTSLKVETDSDLEKVGVRVRKQIDFAGAKLAEEALRRFKSPVLYSLDAIIDAEGAVWWLEINSNPMLPPEGYPLIFSSLFG